MVNYERYHRFSYLLSSSYFFTVSLAQCGFLLYFVGVFCVSILNSTFYPVGRSFSCCEGVRIIVVDVVFILFCCVSENEL